VFAAISRHPATMAVARGLPRRSTCAGSEAGGSTEEEHVKILITAVLALLTMSPLGADERLTIRVAPRMAMAPATVVVHAVAERDPANRSLQIQVNSADYYRSSLVQLDGDEAPRTTTVQYEGVPGGTYEVRVTLFGSDGKTRATAAREVTILSVMSR
jgi:hypothetical protein